MRLPKGSPFATHKVLRLPHYRGGLAPLLVFCSLVLISRAFSDPVRFSVDERNEAIQTAITTNDWNTPANRLLSELTQYYDQGSAHSDWSSTLHLAQVMQWLGTEEKVFSQRTEQELRGQAFSPDIYGAAAETQNQLLAKRLKPDTLMALLKNTALVDSLATTALDSDYFPGVFSVLGDLQEHDPNQMEAYANLAVALAVVYDVNLPKDWPHPQVKRENLVTLHWENWVPLFEYFVQENENQHLLLDIKEQPAALLKFMVDAPVTISELQWASANVNSERRDFGATYFMVSYDNSRMTGDRQFVWSGGDYTLANIQKTNGICVDQAYFAYIAGKARGLPTVLLSGVGADGYHAWFGYLARNYSWNMDGGRYANEQFITGRTNNPQTWKTVTDHQVAYDTREVTSTDEYQFSQDLLSLAKLEPSTGMAGDKLQTFQLKLYQDAQKLCPDNYSAWVTQLPLLKAMKSPDLNSFLEDMLQQFQSEPDLKNYIEAELLAATKKDGDSNTQDYLESDMIHSEQGRSDISIRNAATGLLADLDHATDDQSLSNVLDTYKADIYKYSSGSMAAPTGLILDEMVRPIVTKLLNAGKKDEAKTCLLIAEKDLWINTGSQIDDEFRKLDKNFDITRGQN